MILRVNHVGIAARSLEESLRFWSEALGMQVSGTETVESEGVRIAFLPAGDARIELLEPVRPDSPVGRFLAKRGEGIHHLTLEVDDVQATLDRLRARGVPMLDETPRTGASGTRVAFLHPRASGGVLLELVETSGGAASTSSGIRPGQPILAYLREPSEKLWGVLRRLDAYGLELEGIDLTSFDDWVAQVQRGEDAAVGPSLLFLPMTRVEKLLLDRPSGSLPSLSARFYARTGRTVEEALRGGDPA
jgi:methylmalonyl-CoA/ethylmalonyl-CoA epimerase